MSRMLLHSNDIKTSAGRHSFMIRMMTNTLSMSAFTLTKTLESHALLLSVGLRSPKTKKTFMASRHSGLLPRSSSPIGLQGNHSLIYSNSCMT